MTQININFKPLIIYFFLNSLVTDDSNTNNYKIDYCNQ